MKLKNIILIMLVTVLARSVNAQQAVTVNSKTIANIPNLNVGDPLPDFAIEKIIHANQKKARTIDYKDQLLIIDFWATGCSGCVEALPKMDALQKQFGARVKIMPVTYEPEGMVLKFWKNNPNTRNLALPSVVEDKVFAAYFKHRTIPHEVWVYKGKVTGITSTDYVDANNIQKVLSGQAVNWPVKNDFYVFDVTKPLFVPDPNQIDTASTFIKYAAVSDYKEAVNSEGYGGSGIVRDPKKKTIRAFFLNQPIYSAYLLNWGMAINSGELVKPSFSMQPNQVVWEVFDKSKYTFTEGNGYLQDWLRSNGICFESLNPDTGQTDKEVHRSIIADMDRLLGLQVRWEKRKEKVLVLVRTDTTIRLKSKQALTGHYDDRLIIKGTLHQLRDLPLGTIAYQMNLQADNPYVFDETADAENTDLNLNFSSWTDVAGIRKALQAYGLDLKEEEKPVDKFVFTEVDGGLLVDGKMIIAAKARRAAQKDMKAPTVEENQNFIAANKMKPGVITLPSGLQYKIIKPGSGPKPGPNDKISVNYTGMLVNGRIFDSSLEKGKPYFTTVNTGIKGWTEALQQMPAGSKWIIYVPATLAYGEHTAQGTLPPNSNLVFEIELLQIIK